MNNILTVARKEFRDGVRSRWMLAITLVFAGLALGIAYFGSVAAGRVGFTSLANTIASLATLAAFVVPLIGLLLSYDSLTSERDNGALLLLLSYPLSRSQLLTGKFLGHGGVLSVATVLGFGGAMALIQVMTPATRSAEAWRAAGIFMGTSILLGASFIGMACLISALTRDKSRAAGMALLAWLAFVVIFDLIALAALVVSRGNGLEQRLLPQLLLCNPVDVFRLVNLESLRGAGGVDLLTAMTGGHRYGLPALYAVLAAWALGPFALALSRFRTQEA